MTPAELRYRKTEKRLRIATARLLSQVSGPDRDCSLADLLALAAVVGDATAADSVPAFHSAQSEKLQAAQAELAGQAAQQGKGLL